jgi:hypothetical protein
MRGRRLYGWDARRRVKPGLADTGIDEAALAHRLLAAPGTAAANQVATPRDVRSRRSAPRRLVELSNVSRARLEMLRPIGRKFEM